MTTTIVCIITNKPKNMLKVVGYFLIFLVGVDNIRQSSELGGPSILTTSLLRLGVAISVFARSIGESPSLFVMAVSAPLIKMNLTILDVSA